MLFTKRLSDFTMWKNSFSLFVFLSDKRSRPGERLGHAERFFPPAVSAPVTSYASYYR
jgi:hypothetical protein